MAAVPVVVSAPTAAVVVVQINRMEATAPTAAVVLLVMAQPVEALIMAGQVVVAARVEQAPMGGPVALTLKTAVVVVVFPLAAIRLPLVAPVVPRQMAVPELVVTQVVVATVRSSLHPADQQTVPRTPRRFLKPRLLPI